MSTERRLVFGQTAELYHRYRPQYPDAMIDDLVRLAGLDGSRAVLEVGAGTGKATAMFAARGIPVVAVEPSASMASVLQLAGLAGVTVEAGDFEDWDAAGRRFPLVFSAQAWHWVRPEVGYAKAAAVLEPGGWLAAFWHRPDWPRCSAGAALRAAYQSAAPEAERTGPMHPASTFVGFEDLWLADVARFPELDRASVREYAWSLECSAAEYAGLLATTSELQLMAPDRRDALLSAVQSAIGTGMSLPMSTRLCLARRAD